MKKAILILVCSAVVFYGCHKTSQNNTSAVTESQVLTDFVQKVALPQYQNLQIKATALNTAIVTLNSAPTNENLAIAEQAWRDTRTSWESCEGFLFGPVEDNNFDPNMDTWPVDYRELDSLLANSNMFNVTIVQNLIQPLRGFHPLEFILWGQSGNNTAGNIAAVQKLYMVSLSQDILNTTDSLNSSWSATGGNFQQQVLQAGNGSTRFTSKQDVFLAITGAMSDICNEVGQQATGGKIFDPYSVSDSFKTESPFSHNSMTDFKNNITGAQNVYLCSYNGTQGASISNLVAAKNISLDNKIKQQFTAAINSLNNVTVNFETAIYTQRTQLLAAMTALNTLQTTLDGDLKTFIQTNIKD